MTEREPTLDLLTPGKAGRDPEEEALRILEALLFAAAEPLDESTLASHLGQGALLTKLLKKLQARYHDRGVNLVQTGTLWSFRTAEDLTHHLERHREEPRKLSRAALETLAIVAYHQPVTRAEIEDIRGVAVNRGTLDVLMETKWVMNGPRRTGVPGRPLTYKTTPQFLSYFNLKDLTDLPGVEELKGMGLLDTRPILPNFDGETETSLEELDDQSEAREELGGTPSTLLTET